MAENHSSKDKSICFLEKYGNGGKQFECLVCQRLLKSKRSLRKHLYEQHGLSPVKPCYKIYTNNEDRQVPRSTLYRWKAQTRKSLSFSGKSDCQFDVQNHLQGSENDMESEQASNTTSSDVPSAVFHPADNNSNDGDSDSWSESINESDSSADSSSDSAHSSSVDSSVSVKSDFESNALKLLQCFQKHKLTDTACRDILKTIKTVLPAEQDNPLLNYNKVLSKVPATNYREIHYCYTCESRIHQNGQNLQCTSPECFGVTKSFMLSDLKEVLQNLLNAPGILADIKKTINHVEQNMNSNIVSDVHNGEIYKKQFVKTCEQEIRLTGILNTDGVNLYKSSRVELWPVYLAINELPPSQRFARENVILIALWQGKGKPPFRTYFKHITEEINMVTENGLQLNIGEESLSVHLTIIGITLDLPAKAGVLNMTQFNGTEACITCEEPGIVVPQGRGHSRSYPYRPVASRYPERSVESVLESMDSATPRKRCKGFKGSSGIAQLSKFDLVYGTVPDYMHCVLLGIVKTILSKWFSSTESGKDYFVGKNLKQINERLLKIQPPYYIERLPRDIEKHYANYKATELQSFLLFYGLPCLTGIQEDKFLQHFAMLSEAVFLLLGDSISSNSLERSEFLLDKFYSQFSLLYGDGSCGLNVHNACSHLPMYVRKLGPIWCWSCFGFEDINAMILQSVHGTGDVVKQALRKQETAMYIRSSDSTHLPSGKHLKVTHQAQNCAVIGSMKEIHNLPVDVLEASAAENCVTIRKNSRICVNSQRFYSSEYSRMKRRNCHTVVFSGDKIGQIQYFVLNLYSNIVYAVIHEMKECDYSWLSNLLAGKHLKSVARTDNRRTVSAGQLNATLLYMNSPIGNGEGVVARMPNSHGHAIFK